VPKRAPVAWDPAHPFAGLGYRDIAEAKQGMAVELTELNVDGGKV